jgi:hypothetical protein
MPPQLFVEAGGQWVDGSVHAGEYFQRKFVGRCAATCDYDNDGDLDLVVVPQNTETAVLRNDSQRGHWLKLEFIGRESNRRGIGTRVVVQSGRDTITQELAGGTSYCASHQPVLICGLGDWSEHCSLEIRWPNGRYQRFDAVAPDQTLLLIEPDGPSDHATALDRK